jgi:trafficking protein particle complex subunit 3
MPWYQSTGSLIDEFLARSNIGKCTQFKDTAEIIAKVGFKMFLGVTANVMPVDDKEYALALDDNPLTEFVELPESHAELCYSNILCGVIRGALEMVCIQQCQSGRRIDLEDDLVA